MQSALCPINPIDRDSLRQQVRASEPFPHFCIDGFLAEGFAREVARAFPSFDEADRIGMQFRTVNEQRKIQVTDAKQFSAPVLELHNALSRPQWLELLCYVMDIPELVADPDLWGGGIHITGPRGHLDVHVDFNYYRQRRLHRRLNILIYLNPDWDTSWGGNIELWDRDVSHCHKSFAPIFNRCVVFETSDISYHGVTAVRCPADRVRQSFAAYYYTLEPPPHWSGEAHSTIFRARPNERFKGWIRMPLERVRRSVRVYTDSLKSGIKKALGKP